MIPAGGGEGGSSSANLADLPVIGFSQVANMLEEKLFFGHVGVSNQLDGHGNQVGPEKGGGGGPTAESGVEVGWRSFSISLHPPLNCIGKPR